MVRPSIFAQILPFFCGSVLAFSVTIEGRMANRGHTDAAALGEDQDGDNVALIQRIRAVPTILQILCDVTGLGFAAVGRVTDKAWTACAVLDRAGFGLTPGWQADITTTFCLDVCSSCMPMFIEHAREDLRYRDHPTPKLYGFQSYASAPIKLSNGSVWGTICTFDPAPAKLDQISALAALEMFADLMSSQIEAQMVLDDSRQALQNAEKMGELREHFIAVLGHDIRNPVAAILSGVELLERRRFDEQTSVILAEMRRSGMRTAELIDATLDLARGRLGGGLPVNVTSCSSLAADLTHAIAELRVAHRGRQIGFVNEMHAVVHCDAKRISQMLSNLISNALRHGTSEGPITVLARSDLSSFLLSVSNQGKPIPGEQLGLLFKPYTRMSTEKMPQGLGLGLYICNEIARAHGGRMEVVSTEQATTFTFRMPNTDGASGMG